MKYEKTGQEPPEFPPFLSKEQKLAASRLVTNTFTQLIGYPGSGKTRTIASTIDTLLRTGKAEKVLVLAPTNTGCQNLVEALYNYKVPGLVWNTSPTQSVLPYCG